MFYQVIITILLGAVAIGGFFFPQNYVTEKNIGLRTDSAWNDRTTYIETSFSTGRNILINGTSKYLNFNTTSGSSGYGIRDNAGAIEFKNSGGTWTAIGSGSGTISTSSPLVAGQSVYATAWNTIASASNFLWNNATSLLTVNGNASTTQLTTTGNTYLATTGGNVGIGTTAPGVALDVGGVGSLRVQGSATASTGAGLELAYSSGSSYMTSYDRTGASYRPIYLRGSALYLREGTTDVLTVDGGNVGIGTTTPGAKLEIYSTGYQNLRVDGNNTAGTRTYFTNTNNTSGNGFGFITGGTGSTQNNMSLSYMDTTGSNLLSVMTLTSTGNVGIGTTSPAMKFSVQGDALADSWNVYSDIYTGDAITALKGIKTEKNATGEWAKVNHTTLPDGIVKNNPMSNYEAFYTPISKEVVTEKVVEASVDEKPITEVPFEEPIVGGITIEYATTTVTEYKKISDNTVISEANYNSLTKAQKGKTNTWTLPTMSISNLTVMNTRAIQQLDERLVKMETGASTTFGGRLGAENYNDNKEVSCIKDTGEVVGDFGIDKNQIKNEIKDELFNDLSIWNIVAMFFKKLFQSP
jgi:hypothetical protein